ncbi:hypothetical protein L1275_001893 [Flavobacterium sp. HSC-61S13]|nr:hypothetical protein [Flavobacterium sp. HSC-61S13]
MSDYSCFNREFIFLSFILSNLLLFSNVFRTQYHNFMLLALTNVRRFEIRYFHKIRYTWSIYTRPHIY